MIQFTPNKAKKEWGKERIDVKYSWPHGFHISMPSLSNNYGPHQTCPNNTQEKYPKPWIMYVASSQPLAQEWQETSVGDCGWRSVDGRSSCCQNFFLHPQHLSKRFSFNAKSPSLLNFTKVSRISLSSWVSGKMWEMRTDHLGIIRFVTFSIFLIYLIFVMLDGRISWNHSGSVTERRGNFECEEEDFCCWGNWKYWKRNRWTRLKLYFPRTTQLFSLLVLNSELNLNS